jgi:hypothetical protein
VSMFSFYTLPSSVLGHETHTELRAAYMYYTGVCHSGGFMRVPAGGAARTAWDWPTC